MACHNFSGIQHAPNKRRRFCAHQAFVVGEVVQSFKRRNRNQFGHLPIIWPHVRSALALVKVAPDNNVIFLYFGNAPVWVQWALAGLIASIGHSRTDRDRRAALIQRYQKFTLHSQYAPVKVSL